jgi:hypothetical protein
VGRHQVSQAGRQGSACGASLKAHARAAAAAAAAAAEVVELRSTSSLLSVTDIAALGSSIRICFKTAWQGGSNSQALPDLSSSFCNLRTDEKASDE